MLYENKVSISSYSISNRPFVEFVSAPFWNVVSTRFRQAKNILLMALLSWIIFTVAIGLIKPPPHSCWREMNATHQAIEYVRYETSSINPNIKNQMKRSVMAIPRVSFENLNQKTEIVDQKEKSILNQTSSPRSNVTYPNVSRMISSTFSTTESLNVSIITTTIQTSQLPNINNNDEDNDVENITEDNSLDENLQSTMKSHTKPTEAYNILHTSTPKKTIGNPLSIKITNLSLVKPLASSVLYEQKDVRNVFMVFLLLIIIGEFFSAPAIALAVKLFSVLIFV